MAEICQEYVFTEIVIPKKFIFLRKIVKLFPPNCKVSENLLENGAMRLLLVSAKKTWGHRAYFFSEKPKLYLKMKKNGKITCKRN